MATRLLVCALAALAVAVPAAFARSPLKPADMKTIRQDAKRHARAFKATYHAKDFRIACEKTTPYSARCRIRMLRALRHGHRHDCTIYTVYVVEGDAIQGALGRNGCD